MTSPQPIPHQAIALDLGEAARFLRMSRGRLAELVLDGVFTLDASKRIEVEQLERYVPLDDRIERLPRVQDAILWLLSDWGSGTSTMLCTPLKAKIAAVTDACTRLSELGYMRRQPKSREWVLTDLGKQYVARVEKPM